MEMAQQAQSYGMETRLGWPPDVTILQILRVHVFTPLYVCVFASWEAPGLSGMEEVGGVCADETHEGQDARFGCSTEYTVDNTVGLPSMSLCFVVLLFAMFPEWPIIVFLPMYPPSYSSTWKMWQAKLQQTLDVFALEEQATEFRRLALLSKVHEIQPDHIQDVPSVVFPASIWLTYFRCVRCHLYAQ